MIISLKSGRGNYNQGSAVDLRGSGFRALGNHAGGPVESSGT